MAPGRRKVVVVGALLASVVVLGFAATALFVVSGAAQSASSPDRSTDTQSRSLPDQRSKLEFLQRYMTLPSPVRATEFHIVFHDNDWAPSDWDMRVALKVDPGDVPRWIDGMTPRGADDLSWVRGVVPELGEWTVSSPPAYFERGGCTLAVHAAEGVLFKACSTLRAP